MMPRLLAAALAVFAMAVLCRAPALAEVVRLPDAGTLRVLPAMDLASGRPAMAAVLGGRAAFVPYQRGALHGWPVDAWLRLQVSYTSGRRWLLQLPLTAQAEFYTPDGRGGYREDVSGTNLAFAARTVPMMIPSFVLDPRPGVTTYYLHVRYHDDLPFAPTMRDVATAFDLATTQSLVYGLFLGLLLTLLPLAAYVYLVLRYQATGFFSLYVCAIAFNELMTTGLADRYVWPALATDDRLLTLVSNGLAFLAFLLFARSLLRSRAKVPKLDVVLLALFVLQIGLAVLEYGAPFGSALIVPLVALELAGSAVIFAIAIVRWRQGSSVAPYFAAAFLPLSIGTLANILYDIFLPAGNWFWASNGVEFGTMVQCVLMSFIVLNRITVIHRERQTAKSQLSAHAQRNAELRRIAMSDPLTGIANRLRFYDELEKAIVRARARGGTIGILYLDLDEFKAINDQHGHLAGDALIKNAAARLVSVARDNDLVARLGGDEFAVLLRDLPSVAMLEVVRLRVVEALESAGVATSVGAAVYPRDGSTADEVVDAADRSMYQMKQRHKAARAAGHASPL